MAKEETYIVNARTIQSDSRIKRFIKSALVANREDLGFRIPLTIGAGLAGLATLFIPGVGIPLALGVTFGAPAVIQPIFVGVNYGRNASRRHFKELGLEGLAKHVKSYDQNAYDYELDLAIDEDQYTLAGGTVLSKRKYKNLQKKQEDYAYNGLKHLLGKALKYSKVRTGLMKIAEKRALTTAEEQKLRNADDNLLIVSDCVRQLTSQREEHNPYKNMIIRYMLKGCLLGANNRENAQIQHLAEQQDEDKMYELYSKIFEADLWKGIQQRLDVKKVQEEQLEKELTERHEVYRKVADTKFELNKVQGRTKKIAEEVIQDRDNLVLIGIAEKLSQNMPVELATERTLLVNTIVAFRQAIATNNEPEIVANKTALDAIVAGLPSKVNMAYVQKGMRAGRTSFDKLLGEYRAASNQLAQTEKDLTKTRAKYEGSVRIGLSLRSKAKAIAGELAKTADELEHTEVKLVREQQAHARATKIALRQRAKAKTQQQSADDEIARLEGVIGERDAALRESVNKSNRLRAKNKRAGKIIKTMIQDGDRTQAEIARLQGDLDSARDGWYESEQEAGVAYTSAQQLDQQVQSERKKRAIVENNSKVLGRIATDAISSAKRKSEQNADLANQNDELRRQNDALTQDVENLTSGQATNISTIMNLETDIRVLAEKEQEARDAQIKAEQEAARYGYDLHLERKKTKSLEDELVSRNAEIDAQATAIADMDKSIEGFIEADNSRESKEQAQDYRKRYGRVAKSTSDLIAKIWKHIKYCRDMDAKKHALSTKQMEKVLFNAVNLFKRCENDVIEMQKLRDALSDKYEQISKDGKWPKLPRDIVIKTVVPESPLDNIFNNVK